MAKLLFLLLFPIAAMSQTDGFHNNPTTNYCTGYILLDLVDLDTPSGQLTVLLGSPLTGPSNVNGLAFRAEWSVYPLQEYFPSETTPTPDIPEGIPCEIYYCSILQLKIQCGNNADTVSPSRITLRNINL